MGLVGGLILPESFVQMYTPAAQFLSTPHMTHIKAGKQGVRDGEVSSIIILNVGLDYAPFNGSGGLGE